MYSSIFILILLQFHHVFPANILYISAITSRSHYIWNKALAKGIAEKGHNLTMVAPDEPDTDIFHSIVLEGVYEKLGKRYNMNNMIEMNRFEVANILTALAYLQCDIFYNSSGMQQILDYPDDFKFDLILYDVTSGPCMFVLIEKFNFPPAIAVTPFLLPNYLSVIFGNHLYPSYVPWYDLPYTNKMSFFERLHNLFWNYMDLIYLKNPKALGIREKIGKKKFGIDKKPWREIYKNMTLLFANINPHVYYPQPLPPNIIPVGGLHATPSKKLLKDLEKFINESTNGLIVMSLGTNVRSDRLGDKIIQDILKAFGRMPENILWKFEGELQNVPQNVLIKKWLPQNDILGQSNVKLFIGHGGAMSTQESIYHGVPILVIPFALDQFVYAKLVKEREIGDELDLHLITEDYFYNKIRNLIDNPKYRERSKFNSESFKAQLDTPLEKAVFWVEYVLKFGNPTFLITPLRGMPLYQAIYLDIILFVTSMFGLSIFIFYIIINKLFKKLYIKLKHD